MKFKQTYQSPVIHQKEREVFLNTTRFPEQLVSPNYPRRRCPPLPSAQLPSSNEHHDKQHHRTGFEPAHPLPKH